MSLTIGTGPAVAGLGKPLSRLVLGTASFSLARQEECNALLDRFRELGGTALDSAHSYGESERVVGAWLASRGAAGAMTVITKGAHGKALLPAEDLEATLEAELAQSFRDLCVKTVDLYFLHRDNPAVPVGRIMAILSEAAARGRVRAIGASNWGYARIEEANDWASRHSGTRFTAVSNNLSLALSTEPFYPNLVSADKAGEEWHRTTGVPLIPWSSQARGFFTGRWTPAMRDAPPAGLSAFDARMLAVYCTDGNWERVRRAQELGRKKGGFSAMQVALAWLLAKPFPVAPVIGPRTPEELDSCVQALSLELTEEERLWLNLGER